MLLISLGYLLTILTLSYGGILLFFIFGVLTLKDRRKKPSLLPSISVVVPLYNEEKHALITLKALAAQNYPGKWEVLCVDDRSTDNTLELITEFSTTQNNFSVLSIAQEAERVTSPKKRALETGFAHASHELFMSIDADCIPPVGWLTSMSQNFHDSIEIVQGPKKIRGGRSLVHLYQKLETLALTLIEASFFSLKVPMVASAPSLGYLRKLYEGVGGFEGQHQYISGDDDMLVQKMSKQAKDVCYNLDPDAQVLTGAVNSWSGLFSQRARWASNSTSYESTFYVLTIFVAYSFIVYLAIAPLLFWAGLLPSLYAFGPLVIKLVLDLIFLIIGARKLKSSHLLIFALPAFIIHIPLIIWAVPAGNLKLFKWGGQ
ncbi:MAG: glycosyltransferase [Fibrobacterales bacterium]